MIPTPEVMVGRDDPATAGKARRGIGWTPKPAAAVICRLTMTPGSTRLPPG